MADDMIMLFKTMVRLIQRCDLYPVKHTVCLYQHEVNNRKRSTGKQYENTLFIHIQCAYNKHTFCINTMCTSCEHTRHREILL